MDRVEVAIIGAGAAGLGAARRLREAGIGTLVLEARDRIGGRAHTLAHRTGALDLGCEWLHSGDINPWTAFAESAGFTVDRMPSPWRSQAGNAGFTSAEQAEFHAASDAFYERLARAGKEPDRPAADLLEPGNRWNPLIGAVATYINGAELDRVSVVDFDHYADTGVNWRIREGYGALVGAYGRGLPVRLNCPVSLVDHAGQDIRLVTPEGDLRADHVIVTVPPGLIAAGSLLFAPALPAKRAAAEGLPLGVANKIFFELPDPAIFPGDGHVFARTDRVATGSYHLRPLGRPLVEGFYGGALARDLERDSEAAFGFALDELAALYGADIRGKLRPVMATRWAADPFSLGSYSHALPGQAHQRAVLAAPVDGRIFFAGEAVSAHDFSTAHGALRTGIAAAEAILSGRMRGQG